MTVEEAYLSRIKEGEFQIDPIQLELAKRLDELASTLVVNRLASKSSSLGWLFNKNQKKQASKGLYIWGSVGRGKSMLMDLFFLNIAFGPKRRVHFHDFMEDAQQRIHEHRQAYKNGKTKEEDPIPPVARDLAKEAMLLCFDEFSVTDIANAMILGRLFQGLFNAGATIVATSNVAPDNLYKDGLNRQRFIPFIDLLKTHCEVYELDARTDYRLEKLSKAPVYMAPLGPKSEQAMDLIWQRMTGGRINDDKADDVTLKVKGRKVDVPRSFEGHARFDFADLCDRPLGSQDYLAIARNYHTIFIDNVPLMDLSHRNQAKRFINLIDTLYDQKIKLIISADANPHALYAGKSGIEAFEFERTASRLIEMQSVKYLSEQKTAPKD
ncbi:MAG: cell division protein ZapE [Salaquimonas sp.]